jgi:hypothetical protein
MRLNPALRCDLVLQIVSDDQAAHGVYMLQFYKHGCWQRVLIDNYLPCIEGEDRLAFACSGHVGELWPSFLEKGYAKVRVHIGRGCSLLLLRSAPINPEVQQ